MGRSLCVFLRGEQFRCRLHLSLFADLKGSPTSSSLSVSRPVSSFSPVISSVPVELSVDFAASSLPSSRTTSCSFKIHSDSLDDKNRLSSSRLNEKFSSSLGVTFFFGLSKEPSTSVFLFSSIMSPDDCDSASSD